MAHLTTLEDFLKEWHSDSPWLTVHTSGSTGKPKPMQVEKVRMRTSARLTCSFLGLRRGEHALLCLPLDYIAGKMMVVRALECDLQLHTVPPGSHPLAEEDLPAHIALCAMVPMQVSNSLDQPLECERLKRIDHLLIGGGSIHPTLEARLRTMPGCIWSTYGMTETLSHIALRRVNGPEASLWYTPFEGIHVETDSQGCLAIKAPGLCPDVLHTHDIAELRTQDGHTMFRIVGRTDNVVVSGGLKIQMEEVEEALAPHLRHAFMASKCPDTLLGEQLVLLTESPQTGEVRDVCDRILPRHKRPRTYLHVEKIPTTATGKPARAEAQKLAEALTRP